jgi:hypothetical protein
MSIPHLGSRKYLYFDGPSKTSSAKKPVGAKLETPEAKALKLLAEAEYASLRVSDLARLLRLI